MKDFQSVIDAISIDEPSVFIPNDHPLGTTKARTMFRAAAETFAPQYAGASTLLEPDHPNPVTLDAEPMAVLGLNWVGAAWQRVCPTIPDACDPHFAQQCKTCLAESWLPALLARFADMSRQTLVLEYNIARIGDATLTMADYLQGLADSATCAALLADYPVLAERLRAVATQQADVMAEFISRLIADASDFAALLPDPAAAMYPVRFDLAEGDTHNNGRAVIIVVFKDDAKIVYKPRDVAIEAAFFDLLETLNATLSGPDFRVNRMLNRGTYGWAEFVAAAPCATIQDCADFYTKIGGLLAIVHLLGGFDLHNENVIAAGADPVLIDLETLFHSFKNGSYMGKDDPFLQAVGYPAVETLLSSVITTLMLPQHTRDENLSGLDGADSADVVVRRYNYDRNSVDYVNVGHKAYFHRPVLDGQPVAPGAYVDQILTGFETLYRYFMDHGAALAAPDGVIGKMAQAPARIVLRDTQIYTNLIEQSYHPTLLQDPSARWMHFLHLWQHAQHVPTTIPLVPDELRQIYQDDVPYLWHRPQENSVYTTDGEATGYAFDTPGFTCFLNRLATLNESDLATQKWIIAGTVETGVRGAKTRLETRGTAPVTSDEMGRALAATHQAIMDAAFENDSMLDWLTVIPTPDEKLALSPLDITLYNGMAGMALYFAYYAAYTGDPKDAAARDKVICNLKTQIATDWDTFELPGAMNGIGGVAYVYGHLGALLEDDAYFNEAFDVMQRAVSLQQADPGFFDFIGGAAGLITVATGLFETTGQARFLDEANELTDVLFSAIRHDDRGAYWAANDEERALTGLSHGLAGLAFGLASLHKQRPDPVLKDMINHLLQRENKDYVDTQKNWLDWRYVNLKQALDDSAHFQHHWCNGSSGIGLSRIGLWSMGWEHEAIRADITAAAHSTLKGGLRHNHSLCHGDFGNLDFLGQAAKHLGDNALADQVAQGLGESCRDILNGHILGGASRRVTPPDLMTGLSGVAWGLLRQLAPDRIPDLLLLAPAKGRS